MRDKKERNNRKSILKYGKTTFRLFWAKQKNMIAVKHKQKMMYKVVIVKDSSPN